MESQTSMSVNQQLPNDRIKKRIDNGRTYFGMFETFSKGDYTNNSEIIEKKINEIVNKTLDPERDRDSVVLDGLSKEKYIDDLIGKKLLRMYGDLNEYKETIDDAFQKQLEIIKTIMKKRGYDVNFGGTLHKKSRKGKRRNRKSRKR